MPAFAKRSKINLASCHEDLQTLFNDVIQITDCTVICGHRSEKAQNDAYKNGFSQVKYPNSYHNKYPSMAADVVPYPINWQDRDRFVKFGALVMDRADHLYKEGKITHRVEWGGNWMSFQDLPHFQLR